MTDLFLVDSGVIPPAQSYEWKRYSLLGQSEAEYLKEREAMGWKPVPRSRHPNMGSDDPVFIARGGMILMWRHIIKTKAMSHAVMEESKRRLPQGRSLGLRSSRKISMQDYWDEAYEDLPLPQGRWHGIKQAVKSLFAGDAK